MEKRGRGKGAAPPVAGLLGSAPGGGGNGVCQHRAAARVLASDVREIEGD